MGGGAKWVLVVEDDEDNRDMVVEVLQGAGFRVTAAADGVAALRIMEAGRPALVLSDVSMNDMDGEELLKRSRALLGASVPKFVFLTGVHPSRLPDVTETVLVKPYDVEALLAVVAQHCGE